MWQVMIIIVAAITDFLDGYLARKLNQTTSAGAIIDAIFDKVFMVVVFPVLFLQLGLPWWFAVSFLLRDIFALMFYLNSRFFSAQTITVPLKSRLLGKLVTVLQFIVLLGMMVAAEANYLTNAVLAGGLLIGLLSIASIIDYQRYFSGHTHA